MGHVYFQSHMNGTIPVDPPAREPPPGGARRVTAGVARLLSQILRTLELVKHKRIKAVVNKTFPLEEAEKVHELLRKNAIAGRAALIVSK